MFISAPKDTIDTKQQDIYAWSTELPSQAIDSDMDEQSRKLIEQMLAEEEYYYGTDTISTLNKKNKRKSPQQVDLSYSKKPKKEGWFR